MGNFRYIVLLFAFVFALHSFGSTVGTQKAARVLQKIDALQKTAVENKDNPGVLRRVKSELNKIYLYVQSVVHGALLGVILTSNPLGWISIPMYPIAYTMAHGGLNEDERKAFSIAHPIGFLGGIGTGIYLWILAASKLQAMGYPFVKNILSSLYALGIRGTQLWAAQYLITAAIMSVSYLLAPHKAGKLAS